MPMEFGYWALRGLGEPVRLLLRYNEADWVDAAIPLTDEGGKKWFGEMKFNMGFDFPNLPYLVDGDVKATQTLAILRYLGRKFDMLPVDPLRGDMAEQEIMDLRTGLSKIAYNKDFETLKGDYINKLPVRLEQLGKFMGQGSYMTGEKITYVDFLAFAFLEHVKALSPENFTEGPITEYLGRMANLPTLKTWLESDGCTNKTYTINSPTAAWPGAPAKTE